jgi:hypothetical protein
MPRSKAGGWAEEPGARGGAEGDEAPPLDDFEVDDEDLDAEMVCRRRRRSCSRRRSRPPTHALHYLFLDEWMDEWMNQINARIVCLAQTVWPKGLLFEAHRLWG